VLFNWPVERWRDFYFRIADEAPVEHVCVGEVVCSKRQPFLEPIIPEVIERLEAGGKKVLLSSLALPTLARELQQSAALVCGSALVEANDISILPHLDGRPHAVGPFVNVYNEATLAVLANRGARRIALPPELPMASIGVITAAAAPEVMIEVWAFGRVPLAISARCYHARLHGRSKDSCQFVCEQDPDGLAVETLDTVGFLAVNGVQTLSHTCCNLVREARNLERLGVAALRLSPHTCDMVAVAGTFRDVLDGRCEPGEGLSRLRAIYPHVTFSNGFIHGTSGALYV
jgi:collagenase-like PrtC family protease